MFTLHPHTYTQLFDTLRSKQPAVFDKVVPVAGDIMEPDMGLSEEDTQLLIENVAVVFHLAATIRFDEPIRYTYTSKLLLFQSLLSFNPPMLSFHLLPFSEKLCR